MTRKNSGGWTPEMVDAHQAKVRGKRIAAPVGSTITAAAAKALRTEDARKKFQALGRLPKGQMNKTEAAYADELERQRQLGMIIGFQFHVIKIRLADNTFYEVDFLVLDRNMNLVIHETKGGHTTDKGQLKIKVAAETLPWFRFFKVTKLTKKQGGGWKVEEFNA